MTQHLNIKRLDDGSIDYAHYTARARAMRQRDSNQAWGAVWHLFKAACNAAFGNTMPHRG